MTIEQDIIDGVALLNTATDRLRIDTLSFEDWLTTTDETITLPDGAVVRSRAGLSTVSEQAILYTQQSLDTEKRQIAINNIQAIGFDDLEFTPNVLSLRTLWENGFLLSYNANQVLTAAEKFRVLRNIDAVSYADDQGLSDSNKLRAVTNIDAVSYAEDQGLSDFNKLRAVTNIRAVSYDTNLGVQGLTASQRARATRNIFAVSYAEYTNLTEEHKAIARSNIGVSASGGATGGATGSVGTAPVIVNMSQVQGINQNADFYIVGFDTTTIDLLNERIFFYGRFFQRRVEIYNVLPIGKVWSDYSYCIVGKSSDFSPMYIDPNQVFRVKFIYSGNNISISGLVEYAFKQLATRDLVMYVNTYFGNTDIPNQLNVNYKDIRLTLFE